MPRLQRCCDAARERTGPKGGCPVSLPPIGAKDTVQRVTQVKAKMRDRYIAGPFVALSLAMAACTTGDVLTEMPAPGYVEDVAARVEAVDWTQSEIVTVDLSEFEFEPTTLRFQEGVDYRLLLRNTGDRPHTFVSEGFFKAIAAEKLIWADGMIASPYLQTIEILPGSEKEVRFVAVRQGVFDLDCTVLLHALFGMEGKIVIE